MACFSEPRMETEYASVTEVSLAHFGHACIKTVCETHWYLYEPNSSSPVDQPSVRGHQRGRREHSYGTLFSSHLHPFSKYSKKFFFNYFNFGLRKQFSFNCLEKDTECEITPGYNWVMNKRGGASSTARTTASLKHDVSHPGNLF